MEKTLTTEILGCPFCGTKPRIHLGKKWHCQLHGEPGQPVIVMCPSDQCPARPQVSGGDIYNGGEAKARAEVIARWNMRTASTYIEEKKYEAA